MSKKLEGKVALVTGGSTVRDLWRGVSSSALSMNVGAHGVIDRRHLRSHSRSRKAILNIASSADAPAIAASVNMALSPAALSPTLPVPPTSNSISG